MADAQVILILPQLERAGAEQIVLELARRAPQYGFAVSVLCLEDETAPVGRELTAAGIQVAGLRLHRRRGLACSKGILQRLPAERPLILHSHLFHANLAARLAYARLSRAARAGIQVISTVHVAERRFRPWQFMLDRWLARYTRVEVCVSQAVARYQQQRTGLPAEFFQVIENGIDLARFAGSAKKAPGGPPQVVSIGRLCDQKDFPTLLRAWKLVNEKLPAARLAIAGDGPDSSALKNLAAALSLRNVDFLGFVEDIPALLRGADLYVQPSAWEGFGLAVAEAMACGLPAVVTDVDSLPELVANQRTGIVVPKGGWQQLGAALIELLTQPEKAAQLGRAAQEEAKSRFRVERMVEDYAWLYRKVLSSGSAGEKA